MNPKRTLTAVAAAAVLAATATGAATPGRAQAQTQAGGCTPSWQLVQTPPVPGNGLGPPAVVSRSNVWFPSDTQTGPLPIFHAGMMQWNGKSVVAAPEPVTMALMDKSTEQASFDSSTDGWMWGILGNTVDDPRILFQKYLAHWDGRRWTIMPFLGPQDQATVEGERSDLESVAAVSPTDAWAVGTIGVISNGNGQGAIIEHWNGSAWSVVPNPASAAPASLFAVKAISPDDVYAVGRQHDSNGNPVPLVEHWDGSAWSIVPVPARSSLSDLFAIGGTGANDVWVAGEQLRPGTTDIPAPLIEHWDGTAWHVASLPDIGADGARVRGIFAASPTDVWAADEVGDAPGEFLHWDGTSWTAVQVPGPAELGEISQYLGIDGTGPDDVWASGFTISQQGRVARLAHLTCG